MKMIVQYQRLRVNDDGKYTGGRALLAVNPAYIVSVEDNGHADSCDIIMVGNISYRLQARYNDVVEELMRHVD